MRCDSKVLMMNQCILSDTFFGVENSKATLTNEFYVKEKFLEYENCQKRRECVKLILATQDMNSSVLFMSLQATLTWMSACVLRCHQTVLRRWGKKMKNKSFVIFFSYRNRKTGLTVNSEIVASTILPITVMKSNVFHASLKQFYSKRKQLKISIFHLKNDQLKT